MSLTPLPPEYTAAFLAAVVPWPATDSSPGYVNIYWPLPDQFRPDKRYWPGKCCKHLPAALNAINWARTRCQDIFFCLSLQNVIPKGRLPPRGRRHAKALRAIWTDMDIKPGSKKHYQSVEEALEALWDFIRTCKLPFPTAIVFSGGGLHIYWISLSDLTPEQWQPYADGLKTLMYQHGLKVDYGVTTDIVRVLRVPDTFNYKYDPPQQAMLIHFDPQLIYDFALALNMLPQVVPEKTKAPREPKERPVAAPAFADIPDDNLSDGIVRPPSELRELPPLIRKCPFVRTACLTGGKGFREPLWNATTLLATFVESPRETAHLMANGHAEYSRETTDEKFDQKMEQRAEGDIGWPSCAYIMGEGFAGCLTCEHRGRIKSPLNLSTIYVPKQDGVLGQTGKKDNAATNPLRLPKGYELNEEGIICKVTSKDQKIGPPLETKDPMFHHKILDPWVTKNPSEIHFTVEIKPGERIESGFVMYEVADIRKVSTTLLRKDTWYTTTGKKDLEPFMNSWMAKLATEQERLEPGTLGWYFNERGERVGFCYGGYIHLGDGSKQRAGFLDKMISDQFSPIGTIDPWLEAARTLCERDSPFMEVVLAGAFAGPLLAFTGQPAALLWVWGDSGLGKSTAMKIGAAVWCNWQSGRQNDFSTSRSILGTLGHLIAVPLYWDDLQEFGIGKALDMLHTFGEGVEGGRLKRDASLQERGTWRTTLIAGANASAHDYLKTRKQQHGGGVARVFEIKAQKEPDRHDADSTLVDRQIDKLLSNYGSMGLRYAKYLAVNRVAIEQRVIAALDSWKALVTFRPEERMWASLMATIVVGAELGRELGVPFHLDRISDYLLSAYKRNRGHAENAVMPGTTALSTEEMLTDFLNEYEANAIWTDRKAGPGTTPIEVIHQPQPFGGRPLFVHYVKEDRLLRFHQEKFEAYVTEHRGSPSVVWEGLKKHYGARRDRLTLGAGSTLQTAGRTRVIEIPVTDEDNPLMRRLRDKLNSKGDDAHAPLTVTGLHPYEANTPTRTAATKH